MRLGLLSTMAALLACNGLALGQAPAVFAPAETVEITQTPARGLFAPRIQRVGGQAVESAAPAPAPNGKAAPAPLPTPAADPANLAVPPAVEMDPLGPGVPYPSQMYRGWANAEFILWRFGSIPLPPFRALVNAGTITLLGKNVNIDVTAQPPVVNEIIFTQSLPVQAIVDTGLPGGQSRDLRDQPGFRVSLGYWLDPDQTLGFDIGYFWLWARNLGVTSTAAFSQTIDTGEVQTVTFTSTAQNAIVPDPIESRLFVAANLSNTFTGAVQNQIWGAETNAWTRAAYFGPLTVDLLAGFRYMQVNQEASVNQTIVLSPSGAGQGAPPGTLGVLFPSTATLAAPVTATYSDVIRLKNFIYGFQIGTYMEWQAFENWWITSTGKLAVGGVRSTASLQGFTSAPAFSSGGLLVSPSDNGTEQTVDRIIFFPEFNIMLNWRVGPRLRVFGGWNIIHLSTVAKVGNVTTNSTTNATIIFGDVGSGSASVVQPGFRFSGAKTNLQGVNLGFEFRW